MARTQCAREGWCDLLALLRIMADRPLTIAQMAMQRRRATEIVFATTNTWLLLVLAWVSGVVYAMEPENSVGLQRAEGFVAILSAPLEQRRNFVRENFATDSDVIARRGLANARPLHAAQGSPRRKLS